MGSVTYDDRSFLIDGRRIWIIGGEVHYFRAPSAMWEDRLLKARRGGLNCVSTCVAWNLHESREGQWDFSGDRDIVKFVALAKQLGLYVILRPGPYIGANVDFGGLPAWLSAKSGIAFRTNNAVFMHYYDKYLRQLLPRLAEHQVTRGGNILLIQNEHEFYFTTQPERTSYLEHLSQSFRRYGFDVPIFNGNNLSEPSTQDSIDGVTGGRVEILKRLRRRQPGAPMLALEQAAGAADTWGQPHATKDSRQVSREAMESLGCGAQFAYSMWHGGTNFGFWGARQIHADDAYQTTSYDFDAPLAEGGGLTEKYYHLRPLNLLLGSMGPLFAACVMESNGAAVLSGPFVGNLVGPSGRWAIVSAGREAAKSTASLTLPDGGDELAVTLEPFQAAAIPLGVRINENLTIDWANLTPLGLFGRNLLVFHAPAGWNARIRLNGKEHRAGVPDGDGVVLLNLPEAHVAIISSELAQRVWPMEETLILGPDFVGRTEEEIVPRPLSKQYGVLSFDGKLAWKKLPSPAPQPKLPPAPRLGAWKCIGCSTEPIANDLAWKKIDRPRDLSHLDIPFGYAWHRVTMNSPKARKVHLSLPECEDRAKVYLNGELLGTWGRGANAQRRPLPAALRRGENSLTLLLDNLGRQGARLELQDKGLFGHIYDAIELKPTKISLKPIQEFSRRILPRQFNYLLRELEESPLWAAEWKIPFKTILPIHIAFRNVPHNVAILNNARLAAFFAMAPGQSMNYGDAVLLKELQKGVNTLQFLLWGDVASGTMGNFSLHQLVENLSISAGWESRTWSQPPHDSKAAPKRAMPAWYAAPFKRPAADAPLFVRIGGAEKGQLFLNGVNIGRFWTVGPQELYYLPACWIKEDNELVVFSETGAVPAKSSVEFRPLGPCRA
jgi:hypothetical protein